jgi:hypothetical protein
MFEDLFSTEVCAELMPSEKTNEFFEALFGDASEGSYDIELQYSGSSGNRVQFDFLLHERPGHCLACNLTQGLPQVFSRHPLINVEGIVKRIDEIIGDRAGVSTWSLGATQQRSNSLHAIPLTIELA